MNDQADLLRSSLIRPRSVVLVVVLLSLILVFLLSGFGITKDIMQMLRPHLDPIIRVPLNVIMPLPAGMEIVYKDEGTPNGAGPERRSLYLAIESKFQITAEELVADLEEHLRARGWDMGPASRGGWDDAALRELVWWSVEGIDPKREYSVAIGSLANYLRYEDNTTGMLTLVSSEDVRKATAGRRGPLAFVEIDP